MYKIAYNINKILIIRSTQY